jgi:hypothetical protein
MFNIVLGKPGGAGFITGMLIVSAAVSRAQAAGRIVGNIDGISYDGDNAYLSDSNDIFGGRVAVWEMA